MPGSGGGTAIRSCARLPRLVRDIERHAVALRIGPALAPAALDADAVKCREGIALPGALQLITARRDLVGDIAGDAVGDFDDVGDGRDARRRDGLVHAHAEI